MITAIQIWFATLALVTIASFIGGALTTKETGKKSKPILWVGQPRMA